jgi:hypothetical protein
VYYTVYTECTFREWLSHFLFYFENTCQAATILDLLYSTQIPQHNSFVPENVEGTVITKHWFHKNMLPSHPKPNLKHRYSQISGHFSGILTIYCDICITTLLYSTLLSSNLLYPRLLYSTIMKSSSCNKHNGITTKNITQETSRTSNKDHALCTRNLIVGVIHAKACFP